MDLSRPLSVITPTVDGDVLAVLAGARSAFTGRQVQKIEGRHSEKGVRNALQRLCSQGIVTREHVGSADLYALNREHLAAPYIEALAAIKSELLRRIRDAFDKWEIAPTYAALFGSAARGDMTPDSDIDLFVVRADAVPATDSRWQDQVSGMTVQLTGWTGNDTRALELSESEVRRGLAAGERVLTEIRADGLLLYGPHAYLTRRSVSRKRVRGG